MEEWRNEDCLGFTLAPFLLPNGQTDKRSVGPWALGGNATDKVKKEGEREGRKARLKPGLEWSGVEWSGVEGFLKGNHTIPGELIQKDHKWVSSTRSLGKVGWKEDISNILYVEIRGWLPSGASRGNVCNRR